MRYIYFSLETTQHSTTRYKIQEIRLLGGGNVNMYHNTGDRPSIVCDDDVILYYTKGMHTIHTVCIPETHPLFNTGVIAFTDGRGPLILKRNYMFKLDLGRSRRIGEAMTAGISEYAQRVWIPKMP